MGDLFGGDDSTGVDTSAEYDYAQTLKDELERRRRLAEEAAQKAYAPTDPAMTPEEGFGHAAIGGLPILLGALFGGKKGANVGAQASLLGLQSLDQNLETADKEQKAKDIFDAQNAQKEYETQNSIYNQAMLGSAKTQDDIAGKALVENLKVTGQNSRPNGYNTMLDGKPLAVVNAENSTITANTKRDGEDRQARDRASQQAQLALPNIGWVGKSPTKDDIKTVEKIQSATDQLNSIQQQLADSLKTDGYQTEGDAASLQRKLASRAIDLYKQSRGYGANFSIYEIDLAKAGLGDPDTLLNYIWKNKVLNRDPSVSIQQSIDLNNKQELLGIAGIGAYNKVKPYTGFSNQDLDTLSQRGINVDPQTGQPTNKDDAAIYREAANRAAKMQAGPQGSDSVTTQEFKPTQQPKSVVINGVNFELNPVTGKYKQVQ